jgi:SNF2 family DNA or RNA helicase
MQHQLDAQPLLTSPSTPAHVLVAFEPGLGKTRTTIAALQTLSTTATTSTPLSVLIITPAIARDNWAAEFGLWWPSLPRGLVKVLETLKDIPQNLKALFPRSLADMFQEGELARTSTFPRVVIASYDMLGNLYSTRPGVQKPREFFTHTPWDVVIIDEAHRLKSISALRTKFIYGPRANPYPPTSQSVIRHTASQGRVWLLSGTPAPNHLGELYTHLRALWPHLLRLPLTTHPMALSEFEDRYCHVNTTQFGRQITGSRNAPQLKALLTTPDPGFNAAQPAAIFRRLDQCLTLPPIDISTWALPKADIPQATLKALDLALTSVVQSLENHPDPAAELSKLGLHMASERHALGLLKAPLAADLIAGDLAAAPHTKCLVFFHHRQVGLALEKALTSGGIPCVFIDGTTSPASRRARIADFQTPLSPVRVMVAQMQAAGEAINLTEGREVYLVEPSYTPKENAQAIKRAHRIGQQKSVRARFLTIHGTMDARIMSIVAKKTRELAALFESEKAPA